MLHHRLESQEPDPRAPLRAITRQDTRAVRDYLVDLTISPSKKSKPRLDVAEAAGVNLPKTRHLKPEGLCTVEPQTVQQTCVRDERIGSFIREEEKELTRKEADQRLGWIDIQLSTRPHSVNWTDCAFCDEFHFGVAQQDTKHIKRSIGKDYRHAKENVQLKKVTSKDEKAAAREEGHLQLINIFVIIGFNFKKTICY